MTEKWSTEELKASVVAYLDMHHKDLNNELFVKKTYYTELSEKFGRTEKSYEYRMQNISYVFFLMGRQWVSGLKPAKNVGSNNAEIIERLICEVEGKSYIGVAGFETQVSTFKNKEILDIPVGIAKPTISSGKVTQYTSDPKVKAWVLKESQGNCENCDSLAPFTTAAGEPFLEVHHLKRLADGGSDRISNAIALCPNCHREFHYGQSKLEKINAIYAKVPRLIRE
ncbi:HNH endonuclease signature motif containing protein [Endozoicomonas sp. 8E]|uniref:HNH endonuclease n=1 Tax=Endozoicomonas sp. 8E TaxID=3035692 RepID=UPI0029392776|nr:HNH endonuclease signature motif containing protein [Endozoicomonas sp. 8E]WOG28683.1 HNH endonuclease signature motif containing protein [Endozoicomonas sp. 8E]